MAAKYILAVLSLVFVVAGAGKLVRGGGQIQQARTWLIVGAIFGAVSLWLFTR